MRRPPPKGSAVEVSSAAPGEVLFEFTTRGGSTRCAAIDAASGVEVVVVGPPSAAETQLKAVALRKLRMRLSQLRANGRLQIW
ncbi:DUF6898 family protein [Hansschlegelia zhihuaiae]|uniref:DUF6898 domain-containing protein n=1 Tax=Hansschlegelia zhihuaiae TaxID=405005 RepID=A0A4Q0MM06_9HYPH|nr:hypothetical protein [Hansschlegelia zhihuaiae]RXF74748.1 hypothetical protein EK403_05060 [Hansschlegelia zhihuaiae]